jgi:hypothetical protein
MPTVVLERCEPDEGLCPHTSDTLASRESEDPSWVPSAAFSPLAQSMAATHQHGLASVSEWPHHPSHEPAPRESARHKARISIISSNQPNQTSHQTVSVFQRIISWKYSAQPVLASLSRPLISTSLLCLLFILRSYFQTLRFRLSSFSYFSHSTFSRPPLVQSDATSVTTWDLASGSHRMHE